MLLFRLLTFWLPVPVGWVALNYLERKGAIWTRRVADHVSAPVAAGCPG